MSFRQAWWSSAWIGAHSRVDGGRSRCRGRAGAQVLVGVQDHLEAVAVHAAALVARRDVGQPVRRLEDVAAPDVRVVAGVQVHALVLRALDADVARCPGTSRRSRTQRARFSSVGCSSSSLSSSVVERRDARARARAQLVDLAARETAPSPAERVPGPWPGSCGRAGGASGGPAGSSVTRRAASKPAAATYRGLRPRSGLAEAAQQRIGQTRLGEPLGAQQARVAPAAGLPVGPRVVAAAGDRVVHAQLEPLADDLRLGQLDQRRVDRAASACPRRRPWSPGWPCARRRRCTRAGSRGSRSSRAR